MLLVVNTKANARALFEMCKEKPFKVFHLSTSMCPQHRSDILEAIKNMQSKGQPLAVISTQLIEAGVDISFGAVIRFLAGLDSMVQAAGRCNRNGERDLGELFILNPAEEYLKNLPEIKIGKEDTERVLNEFQQNPLQFDNNLLSPKAMKRYFCYHFSKRSKEMDYPVIVGSYGHADTLLGVLADNEEAVSEYRRIHDGENPKLLLRQSFTSAAKEFAVIDAATDSVLVPYRDGRELINDLSNCHDPEKTRRLLKAAQRYSVNLFKHELSRLENIIYETKTGSGIYCIQSGYDPDLGLTGEHGVALFA